MIKKVKVIRDKEHRNMRRIRYPDGTVSDLLNPSRAKYLAQQANIKAYQGPPVEHHVIDQKRPSVRSFMTWVGDIRGRW